MNVKIIVGSALNVKGKEFIFEVENNARLPVMRVRIKANTSAKHRYRIAAAAAAAAKT